MKSIYILLTRSTSIASRIIRFFTHDPFTHASIAFEHDLPVMYSFARKYASLPLPAGLTEECIHRGFYRKQGDIPCLLLCIDVSDKVYHRAKTRVYHMMQYREDYRYSFVGLLMCRLHIPFAVPNQFFCSQFVSTILEESGALRLPKPAVLMHPFDFCSMDNLQVLYSGGLSELRTFCRSTGPCPEHKTRE